MLRTICLALLVFVSLCAVHLPAQERGAKPDQKVIALANKWARMQSGWEEMHKPDGSHLEVRLTRETKMSDGTTKKSYEFAISGVPVDGPYELEYWPIGTDKFVRLLKGIGVNARGVAACMDKKKPCGDGTNFGDEAGVGLRSAQGEAQRFVLHSKDGKVIVGAMAVPFPAEGRDGACVLRLLRLTEKGELIFVHASGLPPGKSVKLEGDSAGERHEQSFTVDEHGNLYSAELPFVIGKTSGTFRVAIGGEDVCHPSASIDWGEGSDKKL